MIRFPVGQLVATSAISMTCENDRKFESRLRQCLHRHMGGDWGDADKEANDDALVNGERLLSSYIVEGRHVWIITERDRSATTILFPSEY